MQEMSNQNEIEVKITASTNDLNSELQQAEQKVKSTAADMSESAKAIKATFNDIKNTLKNIDFKIHVDTAALQTTMQGVANTIKTRLQAASDQATVKIKIDKSNLSAELASVRTQIQARLSSIPPQKIKLQVDTAAVQSSLHGVVAGLPLINVNINLSHLQTQITATRTILSSAFSSNTAAIKLKIDRTHLQAELATARARINSFFATAINGIRLTISVTQADLAAARAKLRSLTTTVFNAKVGINLAYLNAQIAHARAMLGAMGSSLNINVDATATGLITAINNLKAEIVRLIAAMHAGGGGGGPGGGGGGGLGAIFGGNLMAMAASFVTSKITEMGRELISTSDDAALLNSRMLDLLGTEQAVVEVKGQLYTAAQRLQVGYQDMAASTARMLPSLQEMGKGAGDAVKLSEILMTTAKLSGASTMEAASSAQQFSQALGSGVLAGDELKSILENNQALARNLANALQLPDASTKVTLGMLKTLGSEGKITSEVLANALLGSYDQIMAKADQLPKTFSGTWQQIKNIAFKTVDDLNQVDFFGGLKTSLASLAAKLEQFSKDGTLKEWATDISGVMGEVGSLFMELLGIVGDVFGEIISLWSDLTGAVDESTGAQIGFFELLKNSLKVVHVFFIAVRAGIQLAMLGIKSIVQDVVASVIATFVTFRAGINIAIIAVSGYVESLITLLKTLANVAMKALKLDFSGAIAAWDEGTNKIASIVKDRGQEIAKETSQMKINLAAAAQGSALLNGNAAKGAKAIIGQGVDKANEVLLGGGSIKMPSPNSAGSGAAGNKVMVGAGTGKDKKGKKDKTNAEKSQMRDLGADLEAQKTQWENQQNSAGTLQEFPLEKVKEYWQNVLATKKLSADDRLKVEKSLADATRSIRQRSLNDELTTMRQETQSYGQNITAKLIKAQAYAERLKAIYGEQSNEYKQALQEQQQLEQDIKQKSYETSLRESEHRQQLKLNEVDAAEAQMQHEYDLGLVSDRKRLEKLREFEQKRYEITQAAIKERITLYDAENERTNGRMSTDDRVKMVDQGDANEAGHTQNQKGFDYQAEAQKMESMFGGLSDRVSGLWDKGLQAMINGTLTWRSAMNGIFMEMGAFFVQKIVTDPLKHYLAGLATSKLAKMASIKADIASTVLGETAKTGAVTTGEATRSGIISMARIKELALEAAHKVKKIMMSAYEAMATAMASVPPPLNFALGAVAFAGVAALAGKIKSASGGYDIPAGVNPVTQLHEEEMVLPKPYANVIRDMASNGGAPASGGSNAMGGAVEQNNFNISALDAKSLKKLLRQNPAAVAGGLKAYGRNFGSR